MRNAELIFQQAGLKSTASRLEVTSILAKNNYPLTHQDLLKQLPDSFDRVTLYRVLDWLLQNNIIHRIAGEDRAWRFQLNVSSTNNIQYSEKTAVLTANKAVNQHSHAHFQCGECGKIFCLDNVEPKLSSSIPENFTVDSIELNIKGKCANCHK
jgi:Fur family ferric uptake transcriptional regulator